MIGQEKQPNIIIMYADDLGFGDVGCYGATDIATPNIDRLAAEGVVFYQGYATAATCTPSRYSLLTGSYPWRNPRAAILAGDAPLIIDSDTPTLPGMLRNAGYQTGVVGKWHLGLGARELNWNEEISPSPNDVGFDYSFIMAATNDRVPCVYVEDGNVVGLDPEDPIEITYDWDEAFPNQPTGRYNPENLALMYSHGHDGTIVNGVSRIGHQRGGTAALWKDETMADVFAEKAINFVAENRERPFFLYYAFHQPHVPRLPGSRFKGTTPHGVRGDVIVEMDWCVGKMLDALEELGLKENTIVVFSSDNGPVLDDGYEDLAEELNGTHKPAGPLRGGKYSMFDGGTRVPFILSWPGKVNAGDSEAIVSHMDFYASFASMVGRPLHQNEALDSFEVLEALFGRSHTGRRDLVVEGHQAKVVLRQQEWVYIPAYAGPAIAQHTNTELGNLPEPQLYNLSLDIGQQTNLAVETRDILESMASQLDSIFKGERTRPESIMWRDA